MTFDAMNEPGLFTLARRRWRSMGIAFAVTVTLGGGALALMPPTYQATAKLMVTRSEQRMGGLKVVNDALPELTGASHPLYTQVELLRIAPVFKNVIRRLNLHEDNGKPMTVEALEKKVRITPIDKTDLIEVQYEDHDPARARAVVAAICDTYVRFGESYREQGVLEGLRYVDEQLATAKVNLDSAEHAFQAFKQSAGTVDLPVEVQAGVTELSNLNASLREQETALAGARARAAQLRARLGMDAASGLRRLATSEDPRVKQLQQQLTAAESNPLWSQGLRPDHPDMQALQHQVDRLRDQLKQLTAGNGSHELLSMNEVQVGLLRDLTAAEAEARSLESGLGVARARRAALVADLARRPGQEVKLRRLTRDLDVASTVYQGLQQKREEARVNLALAPNFARVIQPATLPEKPLSPLKGPAAPVVALMGVAAAFAVGATRDLLDREANPFTPTSYAAPVAGLSVLPALPAISREEADEPSETGTPAYEEALGSIAELLADHAEGEEGAFVVGVTSLVAGAGRSTAVIHLADQLSQQGHRVLVVEADFRKPRLAELYGLEPDALGFGEVLLDGVDPRRAPRKAGDVDVVTAGAQRFTASLARLVKKRVAPAIAAWRNDYDYILLDMPTLSSLERTPEFARVTRGLILLVNQTQTTADQLLTGLGRMQEANFPLLGIVPVRTERDRPITFPAGLRRDTRTPRHSYAS